VKKSVIISILVGISVVAILGVLVGIGAYQQPDVRSIAVPDEGDLIGVEVCMQTDILLFLEDCKYFMNDILIWCEDSGQFTTPICSRSRLNEFFKTIDQRLELASVDLENTGMVSSATLQPYIITEKSKVVVIDPIFTATAYNENGFYDYWHGECDESCLNIPIWFNGHINLDAIFGKSEKSLLIFETLNYPIITDYDFALNPELIFEYDTIIMLHNEYVTKEMYEAITKHPKVMYLYPNALYNEVFLDGKNIHLINTTHHPNHFGWEFENTYPYEFDRDCENWTFREISQGVQLLCYPEKAILKDLSLIKYIDNFVFSSVK